MNSPIYGFVLNMWIMQKIDEAKVRSYSPSYLTQEEVEMIIVTPQGDKYDIKSLPAQQV